MKKERKKKKERKERVRERVSPGFTLHSSQDSGAK
jgi:hypothetical protein